MDLITQTITIIVGLITLVVFFVMAVALNNISKNIKDIRRIIVDWGVQNYYGYTYTCSKCKKPYVGKAKKCPHCGVEKLLTDYPN